MNLRFKTRYRVIRRQIDLFLSRKISNRLIFSYVGLGAVPLLIVSLFLISLTSETVQSYIYQRNLETARRASNQIDLFIEEPLTILQTAALTRDITDMDPFSQSAIINKLKDENPIFQKIFILSDSGQVLLTTEFGTEPEDLKEDELFLQAVEGNEYFSDVYFTQSRFPVMLIAEPILKFNQVAGVLAAEIDLKNIWTLVDSITIEETGIAFLLSARGQVIAHKIKGKVLESVDYSSTGFFQNVQAGEEGITMMSEDDEEYVLVYAPVPKLNWGIVIQQQQEEAFSLARQLQIRVFFFVMLTMIIAVLLGIVSVQRLTRPLDQLVQGAREYGSGNLEHKIKMGTRDELAELAHEFNSMAGSLKKNQRQLQRMERLAALSRFASMVSHEVRNPLNSMNINMQILKRMIRRSDGSVEKKIKYLDVIDSEISRINQLVTNFLAIARPPELQLSISDIHDILGEVILLHEAQAKSEQIKLKRRLKAGTSSGRFDYNQLKQVFHNIVINALEAMKDGGELTISTQNETVGEDGKHPREIIRIEVMDSGKGIAPDIIDEIFEFYYTTKRAGTGLGLAIAKQIIEGHHGKIHIKSRVKTGTSVIVELPVSTDVVDDAADEPATPEEPKEKSGME